MRDQGLETKSQHHFDEEVNQELSPLPLAKVRRLTDLLRLENKKVQESEEV